MASPDTATTDLRALTAEAYIYGCPLVENLTQVIRFTTEGPGALPAAAFNTFAHATDLAGPGDTFVSVNNDTIYSVAQLDLAAGPVRLDVPDTGGRYYVLQFVDAWTNNFAYVGRRARAPAASGSSGPGTRTPCPTERRSSTRRRRSRRSSGAGPSRARPTCPRSARCSRTCASTR
jgi:hypothetical protein